MSSIDEISDDYVLRAVALDPFLAAFAGIPGHDDRMPDLSVDGFAERAALDRATLATLDAITDPGPREQVVLAAMRERLGSAVQRYDAGDTTSELNVTECWVQYVRQMFDMMPTDGEQAAADIAARMAAVPPAYRQLSQTLLATAKAGRSAARRQVEEVAAQCATWTEFYPGLVRQLTGVPDALRADLDDAARAAGAATAELADFLRRDLFAVARDEDACGPEAYARASREFLGADVDLHEAYDWGWAEIVRLRAEQREVAEVIRPGATPQEAAAILDADPARRIEGRENFRAWMQDVADRTLAGLHGVHFDVPEPARRIEAMIAPTNEGGIYYSGPSQDWSRPGRIWWSVPDGLDSFATWKEVTIIHHEGVPGHHLQVAQVRAQAATLNRWQRLCWVAGHGEGWALYAQHLMAELGYLDDPGVYFGLLDVRLLHTAQVVLDIGLHMGLTIPAGVGWPAGERWNTALAWDFLRAHSSREAEQLRFELNRYLGWPGQAPSYKLGERFWLRLRADAQAQAGSSFTLRDFHRRALSLGSMGLEPLRMAMARL